MEQFLLGIDIGTTGTKTHLFSSESGLVASDYMGYGLSVNQVGHCEQDAEDWWRAVVKTVRGVCGGATKRVTAISLSTQGGTMVPVDEDFRPIHPAIVWNDNRCEEESRLFAQCFGADYLYQTSGWSLGNGLNALEIFWLRRNKPDIFAKTDRFLSVPDYIAAKLTGIPAVDISNVGINQLAAIERRAYDQAILDFIGIRENQLARIVPSGQGIGKLTAKAAGELGIEEGAVLIAGAHDQYACAAGAGCFQPGDVLIGTGTAWVVTTLLDGPDFASGFSQSVAATGDLWGSMVSMSAGGVCLEWLRKKVLAHDSADVSYSHIDNMAAKKPIGSNGLLFYPYFNGSSFPEKNPDAKASFIGLDLSHDRYDMARAVMEGIAFQIAWILEAFRGRMPVSSVKLAGGAANSELWCQMIADITNLPVKVPNVTDLACAGAVLLAGLGSGVFSSPQEGYERLAIGERTILPKSRQVEAYQSVFSLYKTNATALGTLYKAVNNKTKWR